MWASLEAVVTDRDGAINRVYEPCRREIAVRAELTPLLIAMVGADRPAHADGGADRHVLRQSQSSGHNKSGQNQRDVTTCDEPSRRRGQAPRRRPEGRTDDRSPWRVWFGLTWHEKRVGLIARPRRALPRQPRSGSWAYLPGKRSPDLARRRHSRSVGGPSGLQIAGPVQWRQWRSGPYGKTPRQSPRTRPRPGRQHRVGRGLQRRHQSCGRRATGCRAGRAGHRDARA